MIKRNLKMVIITCVILLIPMIAGLLLWNRLPEQMVTTFGTYGEENGFTSRAFTVFGMPLCMLGVHLLCVFLTNIDPKNKRISDKMFSLILWVIPFIATCMFFYIYAYALGYSIDIYMFMMFLFGALFIVLGNYMPKMKQSYTVGIRLPWTLESEENWNRTHRLGGWVFMGGGLVTFGLAFVPYRWLFAMVTAVMVLIPTVYSVYLHKKGI